MNLQIIDSEHYIVFRGKKFKRLLFISYRYFFCERTITYIKSNGVVRASRTGIQFINLALTNLI